MDSGQPKKNLCNVALRTPWSVRNCSARRPAQAEVQAELRKPLPLPLPLPNTKNHYHYQIPNTNRWSLKSMQHHAQIMKNQCKINENQLKINAKSITNHWNQYRIIENLLTINEDLCRINDKSLTINGLLAQCVIAEQGVRMLRTPKPFTLWPHARHGGGLRAALLDT